MFWLVLNSMYRLHESGLILCEKGEHLRDDLSVNLVIVVFLQNLIHDLVIYLLQRFAIVGV